MSSFVFKVGTTERRVPYNMYIGIAPKFKLWGINIQELKKKDILKINAPLANIILELQTANPCNPSSYQLSIPKAVAK